MPTPFTPLHAAAAEAMGGDAKIEVPPPDRGDLAAACFQLAKARGVNPAQLAKEIAASFQPNEWLASATAAGPFVNFRANRAAGFRWACSGNLLPRTLGAGKTICIDYGSPNISKHLAYHHIRSTTIGHSLAQIFRALRYHVVGINHLGDWGTTHGHLIAAFKRWGAHEPLDVEQLNALYVKFTEAKKQDPRLEDEGREWFRKLEAGDPEARALWQRFRDVSWAEFAEVYDLLGIHYDEVRGESAYEADLPRVVKELADKGLLVESEGARVVFLEGEKTPCIIVKADGASNYTTRDIATADYRWATYHPTRSLYVVAREQALHFRQLFKVLALSGREWARVCEHIPFGLVKMGGKKTSTRLGNVVLMREVFQIAEDEVRAIIQTNNPSLPGLDQVARQVGIGAVVFANLASQRDKDIDFDLDKAVSLQGDSGPYLQYSHARCAAIFRKAGEQADPNADFSLLVHDAEWAIVRRLLDYPDAVTRAAAACEPHVICHYLLELAADFSRWYTLGNGDPALRVLVDDPALRRARLALVAAVKSVLAEGLGLLGIAAPDQM